MTGATRAFALMLFVLAAIACGAERHPPPDGTSRSAIVNGTPITSTADVEKLGVAWVVVPPSSGSGILLSNEWVLTAAHVVAGAVPSSVSVTLGDPNAVPPAQTKFADALVFHPRSPTSSLDGDMALVHVNPPFLLDGSLTTRRRAITNRDTSMFWGSLGRCYGYGRPSLAGTPGPPPRTANFLMEPYLFNPSITFAFSVYKGGGSTPSGTGSGVLPVQGDSGGPCLDALAPAGFEPVMGIMTSVDSASDPQFSIYLTAEAFRDFARAVITTATPPIQFDIDGDGLLETLFVRYQSGQYWFEIQWGTGAPAIKFPPTGIPQLGLGLNRAFVASSDANGDGNPDLVDFNGDGVGDFLGSINGTTWNFHGASGINPITAPPTSLALASTYEYFTPRDINKDQVTDVAAVRSDGREDVYLGKKGVGLTVPAQYAPRGFNWYGLPDEEAIAISAPGAPFGGATWQLVHGWVWFIAQPAGGLGLEPFPFSLDTLKDSLLVQVPQPYAGAKGDWFGHSLAFGRFEAPSATVTGDALVIGAPAVNVSAGSTGVVTIVTYDSSVPTPFLPLKVKSLDRSMLGLTPAAGFGIAVAAGNFNGDAYDDLVVGSADDVVVLYGAAGGITSSSTKKVFTPAALGFTHGVGAGPTSDIAISTGDFNCDGYEDLAIGAPLESGAVYEAAGAVAILYGGPQGLDAARRQRLDKTVPGLDTKPPGDDDENLGLELAAGNFNGDGYLGRPCVDLAMAVSEATGPLPSGAVYVVNGSPDGLRPATAQHLSQGETLADGTKIDNISEPYDAFGAHMTITHADVDRFDDLVIGTFNEDDQAGAAHVLRGSAGGVSAQGQAFWQQAKGGIPGQQQFSPWGSMFGWSVGGTSNGVIVAGAASYSFLNVPSPPGCGGVGNPCSFSNEPQAGWAAIVRVDDKNPIGIGNVFEATEATLSANAPTPLSVTSGSFFGRVILGPRPAFVPVTDAPRYAGSLTLASGYGLRRPCDVDVSAPVLSDVTVTPACLWPPNHKLVAYSLKTNVQVTVHDNCDSSPVVRISSVTSSEPSKSGAAFVFGPTRACLRSERSGPNGNRTYTITLEALDASGNIGTATVDVKVPLSATSGCFVDPALFVKDGDARCAF